MAIDLPVSTATAVDVRRDAIQGLPTLCPCRAMVAVEVLAQIRDQADEG